MFFVYGTNISLEVFMFYISDFTVLPVIMKKNVECIEAIKDLRYYASANTVLANEIRVSAETIYNNFKVVD